MKTIDTTECRVQILVCTNERPEGKTCCKKVGGQEFYQRIKDRLKQEKMNDQTWAIRTGCLGFCNPEGTTAFIQDERGRRECYNELKPEDFDSLWNRILSFSK